jgi:protein-S-isoprenylcysteine O-methyltransferase Ste14
MLGAISLVSIVTFVTAGLDSGRFGWSGQVAGLVTVAGVMLMLCGQVLFAMAKRENDFFSSTVRIQSERGHRVCETGPYRFVRHPGYLGMLMALVAFPLVLGSKWAFIPTSVGALLLVVRTLLEERFPRRTPGWVRGIRNEDAVAPRSMGVLGRRTALKSEPIPRAMQLQVL